MLRYQFSRDASLLIDHLHLALHYVEYADYLFAFPVYRPIIRILLQLALRVDLELVCQMKPADDWHGQSDDSPKYLIHFSFHSEQPCSFR